MNVDGSGSNFPDGVNFTCVDSTTFDADGISNLTQWSVRDDINNGRIPIALILSAICITAFLWNLFILVTYCYKYHLLKEPGNIFLFGLALTDFLVSITILPTSVVTVAAGEFMFGTVDQVRCDVCYFQGFLMTFCPIVSVTILAALSVDRCFLLYNPLLYKKKKSYVLAILGVVLIWLVGTLICIPPSFGFGQWEFNRNIAVCLPRFTPFSNARYMVVVVLYTLIPIVTLAITNIWTYKIVSRFLKKKLVRRRSYRGSFRERKEDNHQHQQQQSQLIKVFGALFIANIVIWSPIILMVFIVQATGGKGIPDWLYVLFWILFVSNTVVHPILESFFNKELRVVVNKGKRKVNSTVRSASKSLIRMATRESIKGVPTMPDSPPESHSSSKTLKTDTSHLTDITDVDRISEWSDSPKLNISMGNSSTPEYSKKAEAAGMGRVRKTGAPASPLLKVQTSPIFRYPENGDIPQDDGSPNARHASFPASEFDRSPSPLSTFSESGRTNSTVEGKPVTPLTPNKRRQVSISLPDDDNIYYPSKQRNPSVVQNATVFEEKEEDSKTNENTDGKTLSENESSSSLMKSTQPEGSANDNSPDEKIPNGFDDSDLVTHV